MFQVGKTGTDRTEVILNIMDHGYLRADLFHDHIHGTDRIGGVAIQFRNDLFNIFCGLFGLLGKDTDLFRNNGKAFSGHLRRVQLRSMHSGRADWSGKRSAG